MNDIPVFYGTSMVARWCGVQPSAVGNWLARYDDYPAPAAIHRGPGRDLLLWRADQRPEWLAWMRGVT